MIYLIHIENTYFKVFHIGANFGDFTRWIKSRRVRQFGLPRVSASSDISIHRIDTGGVNFDLNLKLEKVLIRSYNLNDSMNYYLVVIRLWHR